jgi:hypothetical protein
MTISLNAKSKQGFIDGTTIMPSTIDKPNEYASWKKCKDKILSWILIPSHRTFQIVLFFWSRHKRYGKISGIVFLKTTLLIFFRLREILLVLLKIR